MARIGSNNPAVVGSGSRMSTTPKVNGMLRRLLRPTNRRVRLLVGLMIAGLFCIQCTKTEAFRTSEHVQAIDSVKLDGLSLAALAEVDRLARKDHIALLQRCLEHYQGLYGDYTCTLIKQERINGSLKHEQAIEVKFLQEPFSVAMKWIKNPPIGEAVIYVEGKYNGDMLVKPRGLLYSLAGTVRRKPDSKQAMQNTLRPVNDFGLERSLENLLAVYRQAKANDDLKEACGGFAKVDGRQTVVLVRYLPPTQDYPAWKTVTYIDVERLLPVCIEGYDWDGELACRYIYNDVKFNVGLTDDDFLPEANGMKAPK